jgi:hypothetical protein
MIAQAATLWRRFDERKLENSLTATMESLRNGIAANAAASVGYDKKTSLEAMAEVSRKTVGCCSKWVWVSLT